MTAEGSKRRSKFFWFEGVTEAEVVKSLNDARPTRLRQQGPRRALVHVRRLPAGHGVGLESPVRTT